MYSYVEKPLISIIIPVYNVKKYLAQCVESVIQQTYTNIEIIIVDDGSNDGSGELCDIYAKKDRRIKVIHQENGGLSAARNKGISVARGEYISFIDSDDYIDINLYDYIYENVIKVENVDIVEFGFIVKYQDCQYEVKRDKLIKLKDKEIINNIFLDAYIFQGCWSKLYKKEIFDGVNFPVGKKFEDTFILCKTLSRSQIYIGLPKSFYYYRQRGSSYSYTIDINDSITYARAYKRLLKQLIHYGADKNVIEIAKVKFYLALRHLCYVLENKKDKKSKMCQKCIVNYIKNRDIKFLNIFDKISFFILCIDIRLFKILMAVIKKVKLRLVKNKYVLYE